MRRIADGTAHGPVTRPASQISRPVNKWNRKRDGAHTWCVCASDAQAACCRRPGAENWLPSLENERGRPEHLVVQSAMTWRRAPVTRTLRIGLGCSRDEQRSESSVWRFGLKEIGTRVQDVGGRLSTMARLARPTASAIPGHVPLSGSR